MNVKVNEKSKFGNRKAEKNVCDLCVLGLRSTARREVGSAVKEGDRRGAEGAEVGPDGGGAGDPGTPCVRPYRAVEFRDMNIGGVIDPALP